MCIISIITNILTYFINQLTTSLFLRIFYFLHDDHDDHDDDGREVSAVYVWDKSSK
jgi:hypothetical protein